ncbi:MAG TPA: galactokinase, partial [Sumerlaeia bacterium]|nr:galactokinase [Sumerlaeia bacterium]
MRIASVFQKQFGAAPAVVTRAPGRVNLIGEHIDYNGGHVLPAAIGFAIRIAASPRDDGRFRLYAVQYEEVFEGGLPPERMDDFSWANYLFGVVHEFGKLGHAVRGMDAVIDGDIPRASGLSSSAAFEVAAAWAVRQMLGARLSRMEIALLGQRAENRFVGVNCGIMDQAISAGAQAGHAMLLDCNTLEATQVPLDFRGEAAILVAHSGVRRGLSASAYNQRRSKCDAALEVIRRETGKDLACLCDAALEDLEAAKGAMDNEMTVRARHAITEEARVRQATEALRSGDLERMGALLDA